MLLTAFGKVDHGVVPSRVQFPSKLWEARGGNIVRFYGGLRVRTEMFSGRLSVNRCGRYGRYTQTRDNQVSGRDAAHSHNTL